MTGTSRRPTGMRAFFIVWFGQLVSITGTTLSAFGMQLYVFAETGSVTQLSFVAFAYAVPAIVLAPMAGSIADRWDRRVVMLFADAAAGAATATLAVLFFADALEIWHIYAMTAIGSTANAFQEPAWMASIPLLVEREHLGRANGLVQMNQGISIVVAPIAAGALLVTTGLGGVLLVDMVTFLIGVGTLSSVRFPSVPGMAPDETTSVREDAAFGWRYLKERPGLLGLLWVYSGVNFMLVFGNVLFIPLVVSFASEAAAGVVLSAAGVGAIVGSLVVSAWGGPKQLVRGVMIGIFVAGLTTAVAGLRASVPLIMVGVVLLMLSVPVVNTTSQVIWQSRVAPAVQGRVFSFRRMIGSAVSPVAILLAGPLADRVFEPMFEPEGSLAGSVGSVIGTGQGRGIGFMVVLSGIGVIALAIVGYAMPRIRHIETELPDLLVATEDAAGVPDSG